VSIDDQHD